MGSEESAEQSRGPMDKNRIKRPTVTARGLMIETAQGAAGGTRISFTGSGTLIL